MDLLKLNVRSQYVIDLFFFYHDIENLPAKKGQMGAKSRTRYNSDRKLTFQILFKSSSGLLALDSPEYWPQMSQLI